MHGTYDIRTAHARRASVLKILLILAACGVVAVVLCAGLGFWGGKKMLGEMIANSVRDNPVILEHIGEIEVAELDLSATGTTGGQDTIVVKLTGSKSDGRLTVETRQKSDGNLEVVGGKLRLPGGQTHDLEVTE